MKIAFWKKQTNRLAEKNAVLEAKLFAQEQLLKRLSSENQRLGDRVTEQRKKICSMNPKEEILTPLVRQRFFSNNTRLRLVSFDSKTKRLFCTQGQHQKPWR